MRKLIFMGIYLLYANSFGQTPIKDILNQFNDHSVPYIYVDELSKLTTQPFLLDTREKAEHKVSHLEKAIHVGFDDFEISKVARHIKDKNKMIVVYCSIGVRSEIIGKQLIAKGYTAVYNLYGGIFEWTNRDKKVYSSKQQETQKVHAYSEQWSAYLLKGIKVYD